MTKTDPPITREEMRAAIRNRDVAEPLHLSHSGVSRLLSGRRSPSLETMQDIETVYGWTVQAQSDAKRDGVWSDAFLAVVYAAPTRDGASE